MEAARGQKHPSEAKNGMKELLNNLKNPLTGVQSDLNYDLR